MSGEEILASLQQIPASYRSIFNLYVIEGYSHREIAQILNITESTSRSNLVKARTKLRDILQTKYNLTESMTDFDKAIKDKLNGFTSKDDAFWFMGET